MKNILLITLFLLSLTIKAQELFIKAYDWEKEPNHNVQDKTKDLIVYKNKTISEFAFEGNMFTEYFLIHKIYWLNSDKQIENFNKMYLPVFNGAEVIENKARVITPEGKIINLSKSKINKAINQETGKDLLYYAFEGITKGSFIESYYLVKKYPTYKGKRIFFQSESYSKNIEFDLYAPKNLIFEFKSFNNAPKVLKDTVLQTKEHWYVKSNKIEPLVKENKAPYHASRSFIIYKADRNLNNNVTGISSYSKVAKNIYKYYYKEYSKKENKLLNKLLNSIVDKDLNDKEITIKKIDNYIKTKIFSPKVYDKKYQDLENIITGNIANTTGVVKLYIALLRVAKVKHEIVLTSERDIIKFDKFFEADNFTTDFLIYFPKTKKYTSMEDQASRYGFPPTNLTDNYGLFIKEVKIGDFKSAIGKVKYIKSVKTNQNIDKMNIDISFNEKDLTSNQVKIKRSLTGYNALPIQSFMHLIKNKDELIESFVKQLDKKAKISLKEMNNSDIKTFGVKPLVFKINFLSESFTDKAGKNYLFKIGKLIGQQIEMYQDRKRMLPYEDGFNRSYYRTINVKIPDGFIISNLNDLNINNSYLDKNGKELFVFKSYYELKGNNLKITANEHYNKHLIPVDLFEKYRKVINSAADFNKITLLLKPKK